MMMLLKYEWRKTRFAKLVLLIAAVLLEAVFLYGFYTEKWDIVGIAALLLTVTAFSGIVIVGVQSLVTLHRDMNTKQGYMLFMTPNSSYRILGSKVAECAISLVAAGAFFFALGFLDIRLVLENEEMSVWGMLLDMFRSIAGKLEVTLPNIIAFCVWMIASWLCTIVTAFLADVISSSLLNGKRGNMIITFVFFILLNILIVKVSDLVPGSLKQPYEFYVRTGVSLALSAGMYFITAKLMERHLSV